MTEAGTVPTKETPKRKERSEQSVRTRSVSKTGNILVTLSCLFSLFAGFLFPRSALCEAVAGREVILGNSIFGLLMEQMQGSLSLPPVQFLPLVLYGLPYLLAATVAISLLCTIFSLLFPRISPQLLYWNCVFVLFGYGTTIVAVYAASETAWQAIAYDALIPVVSGILVFLCFVLIRTRNASGVLLFLLAYLGLFCLFTPNVPLRTVIHDAFVHPLPLENTLCLFLLFGISVLNALFGLFRLGAKRGYLADVLRFSLHCAIAPAFFVMLCLADRSVAPLQKQPVLFVLLLALPIAALIASVWLYCLECANRSMRK